MARLTVAALEQAGTLPGTPLAPQKIPATYDSGYYSAGAAATVEQLGLSRTWRRSANATMPRRPQVLPCLPPRKNAWQRKCGPLKVLYTRRKVIVEPVFGQIKEARGFRRFLLRGLDNIRGEWRLGV